MGQLSKRLPNFLSRISLFGDLLQAEEVEFAYVDSVLEDFENDRALNTITLNNIARAEKAFGIVADKEKSLDDRRSALMAKMRGSGTITPAFLKNLANAWGNGDIDVVEGTASYVVKIKFTSLYGLPPNMDDFKAIIEELKPAHISIVYEYSYMTYSEFESFNKTWLDWDALNKTWSQLEVYKGV